MDFQYTWLESQLCLLLAVTLGQSFNLSGLLLPDVENHSAKVSQSLHESSMK